VVDAKREASPLASMLFILRAPSSTLAPTTPSSVTPRQPRLLLPSSVSTPRLVLTFKSTSIMTHTRLQTPAQRHRDEQSPSRTFVSPPSSASNASTPLRPKLLMMPLQLQARATKKPTQALSPWIPRQHKRPRSPPPREEKQASRAITATPTSDQHQLVRGTDIRLPKPRVYVVKGKPLTDRDPPTCHGQLAQAAPGHGRTTRMCADCKRMLCWKCEKEKAPSLLRVDLCGQCAAKDSWKTNEHHVVDAQKAWDTLQQACQLRVEMTQAKNRPQSRKDTVGNVDRVTRAMHHWGFDVFLDSQPTAELWVLYIIRRSEGTDETVSFRGKGVVWTTIRAEIGAARSWCEAFESTFRTRLPRYMDDPAVKAALLFAKDTGPVGKGKKDAIPVSSFLIMYDELYHGAMEGDFVMGSRFLAIAGIWFFMVRRSAWSRLIWDPAYIAVADFTTRRTQSDIGGIDDTFHWSLDEAGHQSMRVIASGEKNQAQMATTTRFTTDKHFMGRQVASQFYNVLHKLGMTKGPLLRKTPDGTAAWDSNDWSRCHEYMARKAQMPRERIGSTSLRRGYATALREHGLSADYIRMIGYWWSDAAKEYDGAARTQRLDAQKQQGLELVSAFEKPNAIGHGQPQVRKQDAYTPTAAASTQSQGLAKRHRGRLLPMPMMLK
jgi:hypothetical protein